MQNANSQAEAFLRAKRDYFFQDAHFLVEAEASSVATEVAHNQFRFPDGSTLLINAARCLVEAFDAPAGPCDSASPAVVA